MTATLLLGAGAERDADSPADLLAHLNRVLLRTGVGGFATCLCADFAPDGHVTLANAGHLAPYLRGEELSIPPGLPLGINTQTANGYQQLAFTLAFSDTLTLISDGVVEARSSTGDLFGFDRTRAVSSQTADQIARTAQQFGQQDDITVLTLTRLKPGELSSSTLATPALAPS
jgi:serine phosphatase RsbU (regulator of sigma subunit)